MVHGVEANASVQTCETNRGLKRGLVGYGTRRTTNVLTNFAAVVDHILDSAALVRLAAEFASK